MRLSCYKAYIEQSRGKEALDKLAALVKAQGGDESYIYNPSKFKKAKYQIEVKASSNGYIKEINALEIGEAAMKLGAGRATKEDIIDLSAWIILNKKVGSYVNQNETLCVVHTNKENIESILKEVEDSFKLSIDKVAENPIIYEIIQ